VCCVRACVWVWCGVVVVWCGVVWCGVVWCVVWRGVWCGVWCGVVCGVVWCVVCGVWWCGVAWCGVVVVWCGVVVVWCGGGVCVCVVRVCVRVRGESVKGERMVSEEWRGEKRILCCCVQSLIGMMNTTPLLSAHIMKIVHLSTKKTNCE
jgi:hypothetical protein